MSRWMLALALLTACGAPATDATDDTDETDVGDTDDTDVGDTDDTEGGNVTLPTAWTGTFTASAAFGTEEPLLCAEGSTIAFNVDPERDGIIEVTARNCDGPGLTPDFGGSSLSEPVDGTITLVDAAFGVGNGGGPFTASFVDSDDDGAYDSFSGTGVFSTGVPMDPSFASSSLTIEASPVEE